MAEPAAGDGAPAGVGTPELPAQPSAATMVGHDEPGRCTAAQLRRFIKSRPYVPMHELRRRFELNGHADDVSPVSLPSGLAWVGLPRREAGFVEDLARQGEIGLELCQDPCVPIVVGVFAMRPVTR
jgi:hypothetical protein